MKKILFVILLVVSLGVLALRFTSNPLETILGFSSKSGIKITSNPGARVFINDKQVGNTPYQDNNLVPGQIAIKLVSDSSSWQGDADLTPGTITVVNREISPSIASSSGELLTLRPGQGVIITSNPSASDVAIDNKDYGQTPLVVNNLDSGEHSFLISHAGFLKRNIRASLPDGMSLHLSTDLAVSEEDLTDNNGLPTNLTQVTVKSTPTGFLRVRSGPSLGASEVGQVNTGDKLTLLQDLNGWSQIRSVSGLEGYVSSEYIAK